MTSCSERFGPGSEGPRCRPALPCDSHPCPRARGVDKQSLETPGQVRGPTGSTSCPERPRPGSEGPQCRPAVQGARAGSEGPQGRQAVPGSTVVGDSGPGPKSNGFHQLSRVTKDWIRRPSVSTCCLGHSGPGPRARGIGQLSRANRARVRVPAGLTRFHGRFGPGPEGLRGRPAVLGDAGLAPKACGVDQLSRLTRAQAPGPARSTSPCPMSPGVNPRSRASHARFEGWRGRSPVPGDSVRGPRARKVDKTSRATRVLVQGPPVTRAHARSPAVSTRCPGRLRPGSKCLRARPAVPDSGSAPMPAGSQLSGPPVLESEGPRCRPVLPGQSGPGLRGRGVDKRSCVTPGRVRGPMSFTSLPGTRARVRGPSVMTSCSERFGPGSEGPRCRPALPCDSHPCPRARGVDKQSLETPGQVRGPTGSTSCPERPRPGSACRRGQPDDTGDSGPDLRACGVDQLSRANRARVRARARGPTVSSSCPGDSDHARGPAGSTVVGDSGPGPKSNGFHQLSRVTKDWIRRPSVSTCCLGHSGPGPRARGIGQLSRANRARVRVPAGLTRFHGRFGPGPEGLRGRPAVLGDAGLAPKACGVDQLSRLTRAQAPGPARPVPDVARGQPAVPGLSRPVRGMAGSISGPGDSVRGPRARKVDKTSRATRVLVQGPPVTRAHARSPAVSTRCPGRLRPGSKCLRARPAVPGASGPTPARLRCLRGPSCPGPLCLSPRARGVDQFYRANRARV
ncbi:collagen alpha-1(I) chain-like [Sus scrofa]|uniref:collagen alpha-1(I) chain-like n=1 Tax=Sus scrofa TaxID=9823 RepID=UPI000A2B0D93|nr:collagen alpha-1(I) chain-like [Sus scrofa]